MLYRSDCRYLPYSIHFFEFMSNFFHEETDKTRKYSILIRNMIIRKWPIMGLRQLLHLFVCLFFFSFFSEWQFTCVGRSNLACGASSLDLNCVSIRKVTVGCVPSLFLKNSYIYPFNNYVIRGKPLKSVSFVRNEFSQIANIKPKLASYWHKRCL